MIAGQTFIQSNWVQHDVRYPGEGHLIADNEHFKLSHVSGSANTNEDKPEPLYGNAFKPVDWRRLLFHASTHTIGRTLTLSKRRYLGLASKATEPGDQIFVLFEPFEPVILRAQDDGTFKFIGTAYVHGIIKGEALRDVEQGVLRHEGVNIR